MNHVNLPGCSKILDPPKKKRPVPPFSSKRFKVKLSPIRSNGSWGNVKRGEVLQLHSVKRLKFQVFFDYISSLYHVVLSDPEPNHLTFEFILTNNCLESIIFKNMDILPSWVRGFLPKQKCHVKTLNWWTQKVEMTWVFQTPWPKTPCQNLQDGMDIGIWLRIWIWIPSQKTNSSHLKMDGWKTILSFWEGNFSGAMLVFREGRCFLLKNWITFFKKCDRIPGITDS